MIIQGPKKFKGTIIVSGDKSITHRAFMLASLSDKISEIRNASMCIDCMSTESCLKKMGAEFRRSGKSVYVKGAIRPPLSILNAGNSGTSMRLLSGIIAGKGFKSTITGDYSLKRRPMSRIITPLQSMGAKIISNDGKAPLSFIPSKLYGKNIIQEKPSAQVKSCILLAAMHANGESSYIEKELTRDHLEKFLLKSYSSFTYSNGISTLEGNMPIANIDVTIPGDFSSASFFITAAVISKDSDITIKNCGLNPLRTGLIRILKKMGAEIEISNEKLNEYGEPYGDIRAFSSKLKGINIEESEISSMIDEVPLIALSGIFAEGKTSIKGAKELRVKESDRIKTTVKGFQALGGLITEKEDGFEIEGGELKGGITDSFGDHRIGMSLAIAAYASKAQTTINGLECASISYPEFINTLNQLSQ